ncbi:hypothetical protein LTR53_003421 [Teratosphaeriaceae sp. CCFEE 6253]|nr:hypothetical protein LTR53_003421 [Teratosphaeriaceae sp. CCFEE 6253]
MPSPATDAPQPEPKLYLYEPSHVLPAVFAALVGVSLVLHIWQNSAIFTTGWILRTLSSYHPTNLNLYIAQTVFIYAGPPIFSAAEYNILGRLLYYLPMHAPFNPGRTIIFFIYLGAAVEGLTGAGAALYGTARGIDDVDILIRGGLLISVSLALQAAIECVFLGMVGLLHYRCMKAKTLPPNVRTLCVMLYGTSTLVLLRCIARAIESFSTATATSCNSVCRVVLFQQWYLYVFEAAPMVLYTYWINLIHPGRLLPRDKSHYLDPDGVTERIGPQWIDKRSRWEKMLDPLDVGGAVKGEARRQRFWLQPQDWPVAPAGGLAQGTATNVNTGRAGSSEKSGNLFSRLTGP